MLLSDIKSPKDLKELSIATLQKIAKELRHKIIEVVSENEGHLGASLGVVELTIALHSVFDTPEDVVIWDVGHQAYGHKILTERNAAFKTLRQSGGISGFPKREESPYDAFGTGHASTSISAALGMALANGLQGKNHLHHIAVIGDASIAGGMALEALNHLGTTTANVLIVLNDNAIGIDPSVGALKHYFETVKKQPKAARNIFEALNIPYNGPVDGHDLKGLKKELEGQKNILGPRLLHVITKKGKGLPQAETDQVRYHAPGKFDRLTGKISNVKKKTTSKFQEVFGRTLLELAEQNEKIIGITPAMPSGSSLNFMMDKFPERCFDVGIAEQHAVTLAAGMAAKGYIPYCTIYSTFLQRAYDQVIHDVALQKLPVIFCVDRAGLVGHDGPTHHGVFDIAFLRCIPNMTIAAPKDEIALRNLLYTAQLGINQPLAIRYPRGYGEMTHWEQPFKKISFGKGECLKKGTELAVISVGTRASNVQKAIAAFDNSETIAHYDLGFIKPLDNNLLHEIFGNHSQIIIIEEGVVQGGAGSAVLEFAATQHYKIPIEICGINDVFIDHGTPSELYEQNNLSVEKITANIRRLLKNKD